MRDAPDPCKTDKVKNAFKSLSKYFFTKIKFSVQIKAKKLFVHEGMIENCRGVLIRKLINDNNEIGEIAS